MQRRLCLDNNMNDDFLGGEDFVDVLYRHPLGCHASQVTRTNCRATIMVHVPGLSEVVDNRTDEGLLHVILSLPHVVPTRNVNYIIPTPIV